MGSPWAPSKVTMLGGVPYMELHANDGRFAAFCGLSTKSGKWRDNGLLEKMRTLRNDAVDAALLDHLREKDPMATYESIPKGFQRNSVCMDELPNTVDIKMPAVSINGEHADETIISCTVELF